ncbi:TolC family protein [Flagellimonas sp. MMG031]|uniref:TolC family protein n=1 Tax=Flagellimonas sp. MMG031 TaxID=3158549 RepID=A0AAU7MU10_9FLAO
MKKYLYILIGIVSIASVNGQELESLIQQAELNNPEIQAFELRYNIASERVNEVNTLPNTEVSAGLFVSEPETRTGAQKARFSAKQMIPWFGTITARENYASSLADAQYEELVIVKRKLALSVSQSYYRLFSIRAKQSVLDENIELLETYERLALTSVEVGNASAVDVLRLQIRQNELLQQKEVLEQEYLAEQTLFNNLLNRDEQTQVEVYEGLTVPEQDPITEEGSLDLHPELLKYDKLYESVEQSEILNQKEALPNLGFGLDYVPVAERPDMSFDDNGKDILMPMVVSIPIFNNKYKSISQQNKLRQEEITAQKQERRNKLETLLSEAINNRMAARIRFRTQTKNIGQAKDGEEILIKSYETGTIDFNDVLDIQELQLRFQINRIESIKGYFVQSAIINYLRS